MEPKSPVTPKPSQRRRSKRNRKTVQFTPVAELERKRDRKQDYTGGAEDVEDPVVLRIDVKQITRELESPTRGSPCPSPRELSHILNSLFPNYQIQKSPTSRWKCLKADFTCAICCGVLIRPVDFIGCGHYVCRTHFIDLAQHNRKNDGCMRCSLCRRERTVDDFNLIKVDAELWSKIKVCKFHNFQRRSLSPSRSLTPLQERFNRLFFGNDF